MNETIFLLIIGKEFKKDQVSPNLIFLACYFNSVLANEVESWEFSYHISCQSVSPENDL